MIRRLSWRDALLLLFLLLSVGLLLYRSDVVAQGVRAGLLLCGRSLLPSLFPMFVAVTLAVQCGLGRLLPAGWSAVLLGLLGGYPVGAKTVAELVKSGDLTVSQAQRVLCCCNNCGGAFALGVVGQGIFGSAQVGWALWGVHGAAALLFAAFLLPAGERGAGRCEARVDFVAAVREGAAAMVNLCGFVVFFRAVLDLLARLTGLYHPLFLGFFELTAGCAALPATRTGFAMAAALLSWGGVSVHAQTAAVLSGANVPLGPYLLCKGIQAMVAGAAAWALVPWLL